MHCRIFPVISLKSVLKMVASVTVVIGTLSLGACSSSKQASKTATHRPSKPASVKDIDIASMTKTEKSLVKEATAWLGTPYKYGGNTRSGVDCSGFVYHVFLNALDIKLPRNSRKQHEFCRKISKKDLATGDLVFFATTRGSKKVSHVGLYVGDGKMIHASTSRGVVCQNLSDDYYTRTFVGAGRVDSFASINKSKKSKSSKPSKSSKSKTSRQKPQQEKPSAPQLPVEESTSAPVPTVHIDDIDKVLKAGQPQSEPVKVDEPKGDPATATPEPAIPIQEPLTPVRTAEPVPQTSPDATPDNADDGDDARSAVLRNLPDLQ